MFGGSWYITFSGHCREDRHCYNNLPENSSWIWLELELKRSQYNRFNLCIQLFICFSVLFDDLYWVEINLCLVLRFVINIFEKTMVFFTFWGDENEVSGVLIPFLRRHQGAVSISTIRMDELVTKNHFYNYPIKDKRIWKWLRCLYRPQVWHNFIIYC